MRIRFSLRIVLVIVTCLACWLAYRAHDARARRAAMAAVTEVGGSIQTKESVLPQRVKDFFGPEYFCRIEQVNGRYGKMSDMHLATLSRLPEVKHIATNFEWYGSAVMNFSLSNAGNMNDEQLVTDAGLAHVSKLVNLESLVLFNTDVTDDGVAHLGKLPRIELLKIASLEITDDSVPHLAQMKSLRRLWTTGTSITPSGIKRLKKLLPNCEITCDEE